MHKLIEFTSKSWSKEVLVLRYKKARFKVDVNTLSEYNQKQLESYSCLEYNISGSCYLNGFNIIPDTVHLNFNTYGIPQLLYQHKIIPTEYVTYEYYHNNIDKKIHIQKNGFLVYCAPTGQGKTYFAIKNTWKLSKQFDTLLYINLELSIDDIKNRMEDMATAIPKNLYVAPLDSVEVIQEWAQDKGSCCFIVDNIDNLVGGGQDPFGAQLEFIKQLDRFLKDYNHHALVLTQLVKDNNTNLIGKDGEINDAITTNILSGVKQLSYLSRSVMMTAYSPELQAYSYKILKVGSAKYEFI
jgi:hypothetical protein